MLVIERLEADPYFNLAAEEYIFRNYHEDVLMLWRNAPAVIIGKHQNPYREVNLVFARDHHLPVIRRISGGGAVYHDAGNINYTFIRSEQSGDLVNYGLFLQPVMAILNSWQIPCELSGKSDLMIQNRKISGNAQHVFKNRILHHGTLLYASNLEELGKALTKGGSAYRDRSIRSNQAPVTNISNFLTNPPSVVHFQEQLSAELIKVFSPATRIRLSNHDKKSIWSLAEKKYRTWEWNFGYAPPYRFRSTLSIEGKQIKIDLSVKNGIIQKIHIFDSPQAAGWVSLLTKAEGIRHEENTIRQYLDANPGLAAELGMPSQDICRALF